MVSTIDFLANILVERRLKAPSGGFSQQPTSAGGWPQQQQGYDPYYDN